MISVGKTRMTDLTLIAASDRTIPSGDGIMTLGEIMKTEYFGDNEGCGFFKFKKKYLIQESSAEPRRSMVDEKSNCKYNPSAPAHSSLILKGNVLKLVNIHGFCKSPAGEPTDTFWLKFESRNEAISFVRQIKGFLGSNRIPCLGQFNLNSTQKKHRRVSSTKVTVEDPFYSRETVNILTSRQTLTPLVDESLLTPIPLVDKFKKSFKLHFKLHKLCKSHRLSYWHHDNPKTIGQYFRNNDTEIVKHLENKTPGETFDLKSCFFFFEQPFNEPHPYCFGCKVVFDWKFTKKFKQPKNIKSMLNEMVHVEANKSILHKNIASVLVESGILPVWCLVMEGISSYSCFKLCKNIVRFRPSLVLIPKSVLFDDHISCFTTTAMIPDDSKQWTLINVIVIVTENENFGKKLRFMRIIEVNNSQTKSKWVTRQLVSWACVSLDSINV